MLYYLFEYLTQYYSGFDVFRYLTLRIILSALTALTISLIIGPIIINYLISKKLYQSIREDGPKSHIDEKAKTPSMGGVIIIFSIIISSLLWGDIFNEYIWILSFVLLTFGMIGFYDDYQKFINSSSDGISGKTKLIFQIALSGIVAYYIFITSTNPTELSLTMPFLKNFSLYLGI